MEQLALGNMFRGLMRRVAENRHATRLKNQCPVSMDFGGSGVTRDISPSGVYFETDSEYAVGSEIYFGIEFPSNAVPRRMECSGHIVRLDRYGTKVGVAVKFDSQRLLSGDNYHAAGRVHKHRPRRPEARRSRTRHI